MSLFIIKKALAFTVNEDIALCKDGRMIKVKSIINDINKLLYFFPFFIFIIIDICKF